MLAFVWPPELGKWGSICTWQSGEVNWEHVGSYVFRDLKTIYLGAGFIRLLANVRMRKCSFIHANWHLLTSVWSGCSQRSPGGTLKYSRYRPSCLGSKHFLYGPCSTPGFGLGCKTGKIKIVALVGEGLGWCEISGSHSTPNLCTTPSSLSGPLVLRIRPCCTWCL